MSDVTYYIASAKNHEQRTHALTEIDAFIQRDDLNKMFGEDTFVVLRVTTTYTEKVALRPAYKKASNG